MNLKKTLAMLLTLCFVFALLPFGAALAADGSDKAEQQLITGTFGNGFEYEFDPVTGVLTIRYTGTGSGNLRAFPAGEEAPWAAFINDIRELVIEEGVTRIGESVFANIENLAVVSLPKSIVDINTNAFTGCNNVTQVKAAGNLAELTTMLNANDVTELILEEVAETVNEQTIAYEIQTVTATANAAKQEAASAGKTVETEVIQIGAATEKEVTVEGNVTTEVNDISHPALQGRMAHVVREITTHEDGTKTIKETITSIDDDSYRSVGNHTLDAQGRTVLSEETAVNNGKTTVTKVKTQYKNNQDKTGIQVQETVFVEDGRRMIGTVLLNSNGMRATETMYTYETRTDDEGNEKEVMVEAKQTVNEFYNNGNMKTSTNTYYTPKDETVAPQLYNEDGSINETGYQINTDNYNFDREDQLQFAEQGGPPIGSGGSDNGDSSDGQNNADGNASPNSAPKMMMAKMAAPAAEDANNEESAEQAEDAADPAEDDPADPDAADPVDPEDEPPAGDAPAAPAGDNPAGDTPAQPSNDPPAEPAAPAADEPQQPVADPPSGGSDQPATDPPADPPVADETPAADEADPPLEENPVPQGE